MPASQRERANLDYNQEEFPRVDAGPVCKHFQARPHRCAEGRNAREAASGANDVPPLLDVDAVPSTVQLLCCEARRAQRHPHQWSLSSVGSFVEQ